MKKPVYLFLTATTRVAATVLLTATTRVAATALLTATALLLAPFAYSQSLNPLYQHLPPSANHIYSIRLGQIIAKGELLGLLNNIPIKDSNTARIVNTIKDPASAGVDLNHEILITQTAASGTGADTLSITQIIVPLTDSMKFRLAFMKKEHVHHAQGKGATVTHAKEAMAWNDRLLITTQISIEKPSPGSTPARKPAPGVHRPLGELALEKSLASLAGYPTNVLLADQRFVAAFATDEDMHAWTPKTDFGQVFSKILKKMAAKKADLKGNPFPDFASMAQAPHPPVLTTFNFENGRIVLRMTTYNAPEDAALLQRAFDQPINKDLLARVPGDPLLAFATVHFNPSVIPDFMERHHVLHLLDSALGKKGLSVNDFSSALGGDVMFAVVGDTTALTDTTKEKVNKYFVATLGDPAKLMQLTAKLMAGNNINNADTAKAAKWKKLGDRMIIRDNMLVISDSREMAQKYLSNTTRRPTTILDGKTMQYAMIDLKTVSSFGAAAMANNPKVMLAARVLEKLDKIEITSNLVDGNTTVTFQIVTGDPSKNSLKTLVGLLH